MKIREGFVKRKVVGQHVVVAIGPASKLLNGMIKLNDIGASCREYLQKGISMENLVLAVISEYGIPEEQAMSDVNTFLDTLRGAGCLDED